MGKEATIAQAEEIIYNHIVHELVQDQMCGCIGCVWDADEWIDWLAFGDDCFDMYKFPVTNDGECKRCFDE